MRTSPRPPEAAAAPPSADRRRRDARLARGLDVAGAALLAVGIGWALLAAAASGGSAGPVVGVFVASAASLLAARALGAVGRWIVPTAIVGSAMLVLVLAPGGAGGRGALARPFGYTNAAGAFFVQAAVAGLMLAVLRRGPLRLIGIGLGAIFAFLPLATRSAAAVATVALLPLAGLGAIGRRGVRAAVAACAALFLAALVITALLGATRVGEDGSGEADSLVRSTLKERRVSLWHDALVLMGEHPLTGVGPGRFELTSPTALSDRDARWAHNGFLQQGAEEGIVGLAVLLLVFLWAFARLWAVAEPDIATALAAVALAALGIHATVDYVLHFPALPVVAAALVGTGMAKRRSGSEAPDVLEASGA